MDRELTKKEIKWITDLKKVLNRMPKEIELIVNNGSIRVFVAGSFSKHIGSEHDGWDINSNPELAGLELYVIKNNGNVLPYSEGQ